MLRKEPVNHTLIVTFRLLKTYFNPSKEMTAALVITYAALFLGQAMTLIYLVASPSTRLIGSALLNRAKSQVPYAQPVTLTPYANTSTP